MLRTLLSPSPKLQKAEDFLFDYMEREFLSTPKCMWLDGNRCAANHLLKTVKDFAMKDL
jgi:hypothetical protein